MDAMHILLIDADLGSCLEDHFDQLKSLMRSASPATSITIRVLSHFSPEMIVTPPDLVVVRFSNAKNTSNIVKDIRRKLSVIPFLGLFCPRPNLSFTDTYSLIDYFDDFITCPCRDIDSLLRIERVLQKKEKQGSSITESRSKEACEELKHVGLIGESTSFLKVIEQIIRIAQVDATILLTGETGTGKELVARGVHYCSSRQEEPFVPINCGALPDQLVENELFGHIKGAYTDASSPKKGLVAEAEGGTLFLDEVDALSLSGQIKLLRFLQEREYRPLGSAHTQTANVRVIAATNTDLWQQVQAERFREDLFYRLHIVALRLPPLRERLDDIPRLALHFLRHYAVQYGREPQQLSGAALSNLMTHSWPGNIRELEAVIQRAVLLISSPTIDPNDIEFPNTAENVTSQMVSFREAKAQMITQFERSYLSTILATHKGNITRAAKQAGKERRAFTRLLEKHDLHNNTFSH